MRVSHVYTHTHTVTCIQQYIHILTILHITTKTSKIPNNKSHKNKGVKFCKLY